MSTRSSRRSRLRLRLLGELELGISGVVVNTTTVFQSGIMVMSSCFQVRRVFVLGHHRPARAFVGGNDPQCREAFWPTRFDVNGGIVEWMTTLIAARKQAEGV
jgi:hypothetical protein